MPSAQVNIVIDGTAYNVDVDYELVNAEPDVGIYQGAGDWTIEEVVRMPGDIPVDAEEFETGLSEADRGRLDQLIQEIAAEYDPGPDDDY